MYDDVVLNMIATAEARNRAGRPVVQCEMFECDRVATTPMRTCDPCEIDANRELDKVDRSRNII